MSFERFDTILTNTITYYSNLVNIYGDTPAGVDWNSAESQALRFQQLLQVCDMRVLCSINDYGCGYGALLDYLISEGYNVNYMGFDIASDMITRAIARHAHRTGCEFFSDPDRLRPADYTLASGIFNVRQQITHDVWHTYVLRTLDDIARLSHRGFAFNVLTSYSDTERMRSDLYYADPLVLFDHCKRHYSRFVALLHDYPLYEFTILVRF